MGAQGTVSGPDFSAGIAAADLTDGRTIGGHVGDDPVLLTRFGDDVFAVRGSCPHYGAALAEGHFEGDEVRCPWHHACFNLRTGAVLRAPALDPLSRWKVEIKGDRLYVREKIETSAAGHKPAVGQAGRVVIIGGGAAGLACANELRRLGHDGSITIISSDEDAPCDRPNLSKDYLAGTAPEEWLPLRGDDWYSENRVGLKLGLDVKQIDPDQKRIHCASGDQIEFDRLLIATGSEPNRLKGPGFEGDKVFTLRSIKDARAIAEAAKPGSRAVVLGSSFIGLEAAAALRKREIEVTIVSPEQVPFERVFGEELGRWWQRLHERNGVKFCLGTVGAEYDGGRVKLANGEQVEADFILVGIGVKPRAALAEAAGLQSENGVPVDEYLETSHPGIFAAGDIAAYPDPFSGERVRIEHWVTAERQGQVAAANMLGKRRRYDALPFFWTEQFGIALRYVGHAARWDRVEVDGNIEDGDFIARYFEAERHCASAAVGRDLELLEDERRLEQAIRKGKCAAAGT